MERKGEGRGKGEREGERKGVVGTTWVKLLPCAKGDGGPCLHSQQCSGLKSILPPNCLKMEDFRPRILYY